MSSGGTTPNTLVASEGANLGLNRLTARNGIRGPELVAASHGSVAMSALNQLSLNQRVNVMDLRGQTIGGGNVDTESADLPAYLSDIRAVIETIGTADDAAKATGRALFGYSNAGYFMTRFALAHPDQVSSLVLVEPALFTDPADLRRRAELAESGKGLSALQEMIQHVGGKAAGKSLPGGDPKQIQKDYANDKALANEFRVRAANPTTDEELAGLKVPTLLIGGTNSAVKDTVTHASKAIPNASVWWVRGANHFTLMSRENAAEIAAVVSTFLEYGG